MKHLDLWNLGSLLELKGRRSNPPSAGARSGRVANLDGDRPVNASNFARRAVGNDLHHLALAPLAEDDIAEPEIEIAVVHGKSYEATAEMARAGSRTNSSKSER